MSNKDIAKIVLAVSVAPVIVSIAMGGIAIGIGGIANLIQKHKIKKGLKNGTVVEVDGTYYNVVEESK